MMQTVFEIEQRRARFIEEADFLPKKAEFIDGQVFTPGPARLSELDASFYTMTLLSSYAQRHGLGEVYAETCLIRCQQNDYKPDVCFFHTAKTLGWNNDTEIFPPPDLAVEILSPATESNDRTIKFQDYATHGIGEYWIIDTDAQVIEQYILPPGMNAYKLHARVETGSRLTSPTISGFDVPAVALFDAQENQHALKVLLHA